MRKGSRTRFQAIVIGISTGGVTALKYILGNLPASFPVPILVTTHITPDADDGLAVLLDNYSPLRVKEADEQDALVPGTVYLAPANYHLQVEPGGVLSLSVDAPVNFARPSVDVLFETAAAAFGPALIGVVMTGAGFDGSKGLKRIKELEGVTVVQDIEDAEVDSMPRNALATVAADYVVTLKELVPLLVKLAGP